MLSLLLLLAAIFNVILTHWSGPCCAQHSYAKHPYTKEFIIWIWDEKPHVNTEEAQGKNKRFIFYNYVSGGLGKEKKACKEYWEITVCKQRTSTECTIGGFTDIFYNM